MRGARASLCESSGQGWSVRLASPEVIYYALPALLGKDNFLVRQCKTIAFVCHRNQDCIIYSLLICGREDTYTF